MQNPSEDHSQFDAICAEVGEWDTLPTVTAPAPELAPTGEDADRDSELDGLIFAALVSPSGP